PKVNGLPRLTAERLSLMCACDAHKKTPQIARPTYPLKGIFSALSLRGDNHYQAHQQVSFL
ncbi:hypothetical protein, partial [Enterobacter hormaechei]|uniref:hypothetical protein n=1 Tax=Enterobacter hormaechei TaxID=158836 RepID=UPI002235A061